MAAQDTLTQADIDKLMGLYGGGFTADQLGLTAGMPISQLVPAYLGMTQGETGTDIIHADDPIRDRLIAGGWLQQGTDTQGNTAWAPGAMWQATQPRTGTMDTPSISKVNFGVSPGGNAFSESTLLQNIAPDAHSAWWNNLTTGAVDPTTGLAKITGGTPGANYTFWDRLAPMIGPAIGAALTAGAGGLGAFAPLGQLGTAAFNTAGRALVGQNPGPSSAVSPLMQQVASVMRNW